MKKFTNFEDRVVPTAYHAQLVELCVRRGVDREALLEGTGLSAASFASPEGRMSLLQGARLVEAALRLTGDSGLGLEFGRRLPISALGMIGYAAMSSATLGGAIEVALRYHRALSLDIALEFREEADVASLDIVEEFPLGDLRTFAHESVAVLLHELGRFTVGRSLPMREVAFMHDEPPHRDRYAEVFACRLSFGAPRTSLRFEAAALAWPLLHASQSTAKLAVEQCEALLLPFGDGDNVVRQVRAALELDVASPPDLLELARKLQTSERSLRRALSAHGSSYHRLLDDVRQRRSLEFLTATAMPVDDVARAVGFSSARAFRRALRRWVGKSPSEVREGE